MSTHDSRAREFCFDFVRSSSSKRFVLGTGDYARSIQNAIDITAYVDDFTQDTTRDGLPIIRSTDVPADGLVVVASMLRPRSAMQVVRSQGLRALDYFAFARFSGLPIRPVTFWPQFEIDYKEYRNEYEALRSRFADQQSISLFDNLIRFRTQADLYAMSDYNYDPINQYFEPFLDLKDTGETFVDIGSFDGQTSLEFAARAPGFSHIYAFEPSPRNAQRVRRSLESFGPERVTVSTIGLADKENRLRFRTDLGSSSRASASGDTEVSVQTLDALNLRKPTFIKMDIEGAEVPALRGSLETIRNHRPRLAISVYHRFDDMRRIPQVVDQADVSYQLFLRHYTEGIDETVMFFIPESVSHSS